MVLVHPSRNGQISPFLVYVEKNIHMSPAGSASILRTPSGKSGWTCPSQSTPWLPTPLTSDLPDGGPSHGHVHPSPPRDDRHP